MPLGPRETNLSIRLESQVERQLHQGTSRKDALNQPKKDGSGIRAGRRAESLRELAEE